MRILSTYFQFVYNKKGYFLILLLPVYMFLVPIGFNAFNSVGSDVGISYLGTDQEVLTFTSLTDDAIIVIEGDDNLISEEIYNIVSEFSFSLQTNELFQKYAKDGAKIESIFPSSQRLLSSYYVTLYAAMGFTNISSYIVIEGTQQILETWNTNETLSKNDIIAKYTTQLKNTVSSFAFGSLPLYQEIIEFWVETIVSELDEDNRGEITYENMLSSFKGNSTKWLPPLDSRLEEGFDTLFHELTTNELWTSDMISEIAAQYLFHSTDKDSQEFLYNLFNNGKDSSRPVKLAREALIPFIRTEYLPTGFPEAIRNTLLDGLTNSQGDSSPTALIIRFGLRSDIKNSEIKLIFDEIKSQLQELQEKLPEGYNSAVLSLLNYQEERTTLIIKEMHRVDLLAIFIGFILLLFFLRNPFIAGLIVTVAWSSTQATRAILVLLQPITGGYSGISFSISTTFLLGAAMNYTVFYKFRYLQEMNKSKNHDEAISTASNTALHSVIISGIAVLLSMLPYRTSSINTLAMMSKAFVLGMTIQTLILIHAIPVFVGIISKLNETMTKANLDRVPTGSFEINRNRIKKVLLSSIVLGIISIVVVLSLNSSFVANDLIGNSGETGRAVEILEDRFPDNYLSRYLITINTSTPIIVDQEFNATILSEIDRLSKQVMKIDRMQSLLSIAWPFGESYNYSSNANPVVELEAARSISNELIQDQTLNFMILQSAISSSSGDLAVQAGKVKEVISTFLDEAVGINRIQISGLPEQVQRLSNEISSDLPYQIITALLLLTAFLWIVLRSILVPIRLEFSILLASVYSLAISSLLLKIITNIPLNILVIASTLLILLGLGTDFDIYLYRRIIEEKETQNISFEEAVKEGVKQSAPAIVASGLVMGSSFLSLLSSDVNIVRQFGLVMFITIIIDIFIVRTIIVPALLLFTHKEEIDT